MSQDCIFCKIRSGEIKSDIVHRDDTCFVVRDLAPAAPIHLLIIPNEHITRLAPELHPAVGGMFVAAAEMARREGVDDTGYRLVINQGAHGGQVVEHLHLHLLAGKPLGAMG